MTTEKDHQIIVSELRPMDQDTIVIGWSASVLVYYKNYDVPSVAEFTTHSGWSRKITKAIGWIPMPIYQPNKPETVDIYMPEFDGPIPTDDQV